MSERANRRSIHVRMKEASAMARQNTIRLHLTIVVDAVGLLLVGVAMFLNSWPCYVLGFLMLIGGVIYSLVGANDEDYSLSLSDWAKSQIRSIGKPEFSIVMVDSGENKMAVIRCLRGIYSLDLKRAYSLVEKMPSLLSTAVSQEEAEWVAARLSECGARVEIEKPTE